MSTRIKYFKITNENENHKGFQYVDGLNILNEPFNKTGSCVPGGLYFTDAENIMKFMNYGVWLRDVELPTTDPNFKMVKDPDGDKYRANMIILGKKYSLYEKETFEYLFECGADFLYIPYGFYITLVNKRCYDLLYFFVKIYQDDDVLGCILSHGDFELLKFLVEKGIDISGVENSIINRIFHAANSAQIKFMIEHGISIGRLSQDTMDLIVLKFDIEFIKYLEKNGCNIKNMDTDHLQNLFKKGDFDTIKYFVKNVIHINEIERETVNELIVLGKLDIIKYLFQKGLIFLYVSDYAVDKILKSNEITNKKEIFDFLVSNGVKFDRVSSFTIRNLLFQNRDFEGIKFLVKNGAKAPIIDKREVQQFVLKEHQHTIKILVETSTIHPGKINYDEIVKSRSDCFEITKTIIETMEIPDPKSVYNLVLKAAARFGNLDLVDYILNKGADARTAEDYAIRWACRKGFLPVVKLLVKFGADATTKNYYCKECAKRLGHKPIVDYLDSLDKPNKIEF